MFTRILCTCCKFCSLRTSCQIEQLLPLLYRIQCKLAFGVRTLVIAIGMYVTFILVSGDGMQLSLQWVDLTYQFNRCTFILRISIVVLLNVASSFHVDHELVDFVPVGEPEYDEVIEEYEEEIFAQEDAQEPIGADLAPAQGKPWSIIHIFMITIYIYVMCI